MLQGVTGAVVAQSKASLSPYFRLHIISCIAHHHSIPLKWWPAPCQAKNFKPPMPQLDTTTQRGALSVSRCSLAWWKP